MSLALAGGTVSSVIFAASNLPDAGQGPPHP